MMPASLAPYTLHWDVPMRWAGGKGWPGEKGHWTGHFEDNIAVHRAFTYGTQPRRIPH